MESIEGQMNSWVIHTKIKRLEPRRRALRARKSDDGTTIEYEDLGWFVQFEGSWESIHLGMDRPNIQVGDDVKFTIEVTKSVPGRV